MGSFQATRAATRSVSTRTPRPSSRRPSVRAPAKESASHDAADVNSVRIVLRTEATGEGDESFEANVLAAGTGAAVSSGRAGRFTGSAPRWDSRWATGAGTSPPPAAAPP